MQLDAGGIDGIGSRSRNFFHQMADRVGVALLGNIGLADDSRASTRVVDYRNSANHVLFHSLATIVG